MEVKRFSILFVLVTGVLLALVIPHGRVGWGENDFLPYWSASKTMLAGGNPYDPNDLFQEQVAIRSDLDELSEVAPAWGPPWMMLLISPLTWLEFEVAARIWIFCNVFFLSMALYLLWEMLFDPSDTKGLILTFGVGFLFGNTIKLIELGQFSAILLIAFVLCIWCLERELYTWAGIALLFLTIKPQITYLVLAVIFIWVFRNRKWGVFTGFIVSGISLLVLLWLVFPNWLGAYIKTVIFIPSFTIYYTTIGSFIESLFGISAFKYIGLLLLPLSFPFSKYVGKSGWLTILNLTLLISIPLAPYGFSFDHVLLLPAVVQLVSWIWNKDLPVNYAWGIGIGILISYGFVYFLMSIPSGLPYYWLVWPSIGLGLIYLFVWWKNKAKLQTSEPY
jgi:hypothetical protein